MPRDPREVPSRMGGYPPPPPAPGKLGHMQACSSTRLRTLAAQTTAGDTIRSVDSHPNPRFKLAAFARKIACTDGQCDYLVLGTHKG
jgi:hypothetical protein